MSSSPKQQVTVDTVVIGVAIIFAASVWNGGCGGRGEVELEIRKIHLLQMQEELVVEKGGAR